jgi:hypothetical protein
MVEFKHMVQGDGDSPKYKFSDIYVQDRQEAMAVDTSLLIQGSKLFIIETAELFILNKDGGVWCSAVDGAFLK